MLKLRPLNKKGQESKGFSAMIEITLWILGFIIILGVVMYLVVQGSTAAQETVCRDTVVLRGKANIQVGFLPIKDKITPLICSPIDKGTLEGSREDVKHQIAELTAKCWWMYAEGTINDLFKKEAGEKGCNVCYFFTIQKGMSVDASSAESFFREPERKLDSISSEEMYNYLLENNYNPKLLYGGGTSNYIGDVYDFDSDIINENPGEIRLADIDFPSTDYVIDFSDRMTSETRKNIEEIGLDLQQKQVANLMVVVADELSRNARKDARRLVERIGLNSDDKTYDAMLITVDIENRNVRVHMGSALEEYINEFEIQDIIKDNFKGRISDINKPVEGLIKDMRDKIVENKDSYFSEISIGRKSYYAYISNLGSSYATIFPMDAGKTYAVTFMSPTSHTEWLQGMWDNIVGAGTDIGTVVVSAAAIVLVVYVSKGKVGIPLILKAIASGAAFTVGQAIFDQEMAQGLGALMGNIDTQNPNHIIVSRINDISIFCEVN